MTRDEWWRREVLENPGAFGAEDRAIAWEMTARQCRANGVEWAAEIADDEAKKARTVPIRLLETR
jgi:hypothetical protein